MEFNGIISSREINLSCCHYLITLISAVIYHFVKLEMYQEINLHLRKSSLVTGSGANACLLIVELGCTKVLIPSVSVSEIQVLFK